MHDDSVESTQDRTFVSEGGEQTGTLSQLKHDLPSRHRGLNARPR